jgi:hypothetical protein
VSGSGVPYHLRPNKFVERQLFFEALRLVDRWQPIESYCYISMGGRFLEDFRQIHSAFNIKNLISIESNQHICLRQEFNRPIGSLKCLHMTSGDLITNFDEIIENIESQNQIIWMDYADASQRFSQLGELESLAKKLGKNDIIKITLNANLATLGEPKNLRPEDRQEQQFNTVRSKLGSDYLPSSTMFSAADMTNEGFGKILIHAIQNALKKGLRGRGLIAVPLSAFLYSDQHQMLTYSAILLPESEQTNFIEKTKICDWEFCIEDNIPRNIKVPDLSLKERLTIDAMSFEKTAEEIHNSLGFKFDEEEDSSMKILQNYLEHYRRYPSFIRALV